jgi:hypothetical protein
MRRMGTRKRNVEKNNARSAAHHAKRARLDVDSNGQQQQVPPQQNAVPALPQPQQETPQSATQPQQQFPQNNMPQQEPQPFEAQTNWDAFSQQDWDDFFASVEIPAVAATPVAAEPSPFATWPKNLSKEEFLRRLNDEPEFLSTSQQPSQRSASSAGGFADQRETSTEGNNSVPTRNPTAVIPALGQELSSTTGPATTPSLLSGGHKSPAATAGYDFDKEVDQVLISEGFKRAAEMDNSMVMERYGRCSKEYHQLQLYLDPSCQSTIANYVATGMRVDAHNSNGCRPALVDRLKVKASDIQCPHCGKKVLRERMIASRVVAVYNLPREDLWKAVIKPFGKDGSPSYLFQASAVCNVFQGTKHCVHSDHVHFETLLQNCLRQNHHSGRYGCWDPIPCIGEHVLVGALTAHEIANGQKKGKVPLR